MKQFIHIPKTGGTSIKFMQSTLDDWTYNNHVSKLADLENNVVFTIRDPLTRFSSAIKHHLAQSNITEAKLDDYVSMLVNDNFGRKDYILFQSMTNWLGTVDEYKQHEHKVVAAVETGAINNYFSSLGVEAKHARNHKSYNLNFDETVSIPNRLLFRQHFVEDYALYRYIRTRPYYVGA